ncbi:MAG: AAA family ATPase [Gemmatimonadetes bacterium]|nr:AAA family ATPase [Gemmatimonadota bacterium]
MSTTIAVAGKGGTGKTLIAALLIRLLARKGTVLAIDADPSMNLHMALGLDEPDTLGAIREEISADGNSLPAGMTRHDYLAFRARQALMESVGLDLIAMGRPEGPGCYCAANHILRQTLDRLTNAYDYVVIDNEAGMEHISRRTTRDVHILLLVSDPTLRGITAAARAQELLGELRARVETVRLVVNRVDGTLPPEIAQAIDKHGLQLAATVPSDDDVRNLDTVGRPFVELPAHSPVVKAVSELAERLGLLTPAEAAEAAALSPRSGQGV